MILGAATALMMALSWPLWGAVGDIPRVPFVREMPQLDGSRAWLLAGAVWLCVVLSAVARRWRRFLALALTGLAVLWLQDQHRFQAWSYQYAMTGLFLALLPDARGLRLARCWYVSLYVHSGLSKLDVSFCDELGARFLTVATRPFGLDPWAWPAGTRRAVVLVMPLGELLAATALASRRTRWLGLAGVSCLHLGLVGILGPAGLGHSTIVLMWNLAMLCEVWVAFGSSPGQTDLAPTQGFSVRSVAAWSLFLVGILAPLGERWGAFDAWPSHALYASHVERLTLDVHEEDVGRYPASLQASLLPQVEPPWRRVDLTAWSRRERGTPLYPQNRAGLGLAEALAARYGGPGLVRVTLHGPADRWRGRRPRTEWIGAESIRRQADRSFLNSHPWPHSPAPSAP